MLGRSVAPSARCTTRKHAWPAQRNDIAEGGKRENPMRVVGENGAVLDLSGELFELGPEIPLFLFEQGSVIDG